MAYFNIKERKIEPRPIPPTPPYVPPTPPTPPQPGEGSTPDIIRPTYNSNITITLYQTTSENNMINKVLTNSKQFSNVFKVDTDSIRPVIEIETSDNISQYNYCYIDIFHRYYYINDIELSTGHIFKLYLTVDVLMSHKDGIKNMVCILDRVQEKGKAYLNLSNENYVNDLGNRTTIKKFPTKIFSSTPKLVLVVNGAYSESTQTGTDENSGPHIGVLDGDGSGVV